MNHKQHRNYLKHHSKFHPPTVPLNTLEIDGTTMHTPLPRQLHTALKALQATLRQDCIGVTLISINQTRLTKAIPPRPGEPVYVRPALNALIIHAVEELVLFHCPELLPKPPRYLTHPYSDHTAFPPYETI